MDFSKYIACICEGTAEQVIINILLDNNKLIFDRKDLLEEDVLRSRSGQKFEQQYLRKGFDDKRNENFKISRAYQHKIDVINIITAPEIEMLIICNENKYEDYKKSKKKPSSYCKEDLSYKNVKSKTFITEYFEDVDSLINAIKEYKRVSNIPNHESSLFDLLKKE